ncbi:hypothetical protein ANN_22408 [Periplaneta americana]|uniref:DUF4817 domain-containing protein n=1 Tax=Periplaneta americana TaxID=6978 RepID=A0ABQ8S828_PERAM|nr:hypothetical protein ANN_22408 [Periplaneta americana]
MRIRERARSGRYMVSRETLRRYATRRSETNTNGTEFDAMTEDIREGIDSNKVTILTLLDLSKAFNSVNFDLLTLKLRNLHLSETAVSWFESYLRERQQCVISGNRSSSWLNITSDRINDAIDKLNEDIDSIVIWTKKFHLNINPGKTQAIILGNKRQTDAVKHLDISPVKTLVFPYFDYADILLTDLSSDNKTKLQRAHNLCYHRTPLVEGGRKRYFRFSTVNPKSLPSKETLRGHSDSSFRGEGYIQCCVGVRLCDMYSNQELAEIHFMYKADGNAALARRLYQERYPQRQCPDRKTFVRLHYRLCEYGKFNSPGLGRGRPRSTTPEVQGEILEAVNMTPSISTRRVALQVNVPHTTVWRLLKEYQLYPYHLQRVQALSSADYPARVRFCQWFLQQCGVNPNLVLFTDEAQFTRDGITNFHNQHVWAYENPRATVPSHHQHVGRYHW